MARARYTYQDVLVIFGNEGYEVLSTERELLNNKGFIYATTKIEVKCPKGHITNTITINSFKNRKRCRKCADEKLGNDKAFTYEEVKSYIESFNYILLSTEYKNVKEYIVIQPPCGHEAYLVTFEKFKDGNRCPKCKGKRISEAQRIPYQEVKEYIENEGYELLSKEYKDANSPLIIKCPIGHITNTMTFGNFKQGHRCLKCQESKGEKKITNYLNNNNINFISQYKFNDLLGIGNGLLSYDFYLPKYNLLIEYQGEFHDGNITGSYKKDFDLEKQQEHDRRKRMYAKKNNIRLLEIWYWDFDNIEEILKLELK